MTAGTQDQRTWLITGASSGFGRAIAEAALRAGDAVVAGVRRVDALAELADSFPDRLHVVNLDVTSPGSEALVDQVVADHGRIDVLVNNAGRTQVGALEETTEEELRALFELHLFGPALLTRAVLPHMRRQGGGTVVQISSVGGQVCAPGFGVYCSSKFALEGLTEAVSLEVDSKIRFVIVEPGAFRTGLFGAGAATMSTAMPEYADTVGVTRSYVTEGGGTQPGDPAKAASAILQAVDASEPPLRLVLGPDAVHSIRERWETMRAELEQWEQVSRSTDLDDASRN